MEWFMTTTVTFCLFIGILVVPDTAVSSTQLNTNKQLSFSLNKSTLAPTLQFREELLPGCDRSTRVQLSIINIISSILALLGNGLVIALTIKQWSLFSKFRKLLVALCITDFIFGLVLLLMSLPELWTCKWLYGHFMCGFLKGVFAASGFIALGFIVIIAIDRYIVICHSFSYWMTTRKLRVIVAINVIAGIISAIPSIVINGVNNYGICEGVVRRDIIHGYAIFTITVYFALPILVIAVLYVLIIVELYASMKLNSVLSKQQREERKKSNIRNLLIFFTIVVLFAILVLPSRLFWFFIDSYDLLDSSKVMVYNVLKMGVIIPCAIHIFVNPIIYTIGDPSFRKQLGTLCHCASSSVINSSSQS